LREDVKDQASRKSPGEAGLQTKRHGYHHAEDENEVRLCGFDPQVRANTEFQ
jgi:hypothetical protein